MEFCESEIGSYVLVLASKYAPFDGSSRVAGSEPEPQIPPRTRRPRSFDPSAVKTCD